MSNQETTEKETASGVAPAYSEQGSAAQRMHRCMRPTARSKRARCGDERLFGAVVGGRCRSAGGQSDRAEPVGRRREQRACDRALSGPGYCCCAGRRPPPGYYVLLWGWVKLFGNGEVAVRALSVCDRPGFGWAGLPGGQPLVWRACCVAGCVLRCSVSLSGGLLARSAHVYPGRVLGHGGDPGLGTVDRACWIRGDTWSAGRAGFGASLYVLCAAAGLWTHYSFPIVLAALNVAWLVWWLWGRERSGPVAVLALVGGHARLVWCSMRLGSLWPWTESCTMVRSATQSRSRLSSSRRSSCSAWARRCPTTT